MFLYLNTAEEMREKVMNENEKIYKSMTVSGVMAIITGIVVLCVGLAAGVVMIISGGKLMSRRNDMII